MDIKNHKVNNNATIDECELVIDETKACSVIQDLISFFNKHDFVFRSLRHIVEKLHDEIHDRDAVALLNEVFIHAVRCANSMLRYTFFENELGGCGFSYYKNRECNKKDLWFEYKEGWFLLLPKHEADERYKQMALAPINLKPQTKKTVSRYTKKYFSVYFLNEQIDFCVIRQQIVETEGQFCFEQFPVLSTYDI